jgi:hypothetical protein
VLVPLGRHLLISCSLHAVAELILIIILIVDIDLIIIIIIISFLCSGKGHREQPALPNPLLPDWAPAELQGSHQ